MVVCSVCSKSIVTNFACSALGTTHLRIGLSAYLLNDAYNGNKNSYNDSEAFRIYCNDCYAAGHYHKKIIEKYPKIFEQAQQKRFAQLNKTLEQQKTRIVALEQQLKKARGQSVENGGFQEIYKRFEQIYQSEPKKVKTLQTFKSFGKDIANKDAEFKKRMEQFFRKLERDYVNSSIMRIQGFFVSYIKQIDRKIHNCEADIQRIKQLQRQVIGMCSEQRSSFHQQRLINNGRIQSMNTLFENEIKNFEKTLNELKKVQNEGILQFKEQELQLSKMEMSFHQMSDAQMHAKKQKASKFENISL